jgi:hypothetical protein
MIMLLPFLTALIAIWFAIRGQRAAAIGLWVITLAIYVAWMKYHMTDALNISL